MAATARQLVTMSALAEGATVNSEVADGSALVSLLGGLGFGDALMASIRAGWLGPKLLAEDTAASHSTAEGRG